ncbi:MAG: hypothetical protein MZW92_57690 [Comamonadaceae bacterium]|nr:hypothetical protein [Comamonadaceae bacterium]
MERPPRRHGLARRWTTPYQIPAPYPRGKYLLVFDPLDGSQQHRRQRLGRQHLLDPARAAGRDRQRPRRHRGRLPAARRDAGGRRLRALRPGRRCWC